MKTLMIILLTAYYPITAFSQVDIPVCPKSTLPDISSGYWDTPSNWPMVLTNNNLTYPLSVRFNNPDNSIARDFDEAMASGGEFSARYPIASVHIRKDAEHQPKNDEDLAYGPHYGWRSDGSIFMKSFQHPEGIDEIYYYTTNEMVAKAWFVDSRSNRSVMVLYDSNNVITGFLEAPDSGITRSILEGKGVDYCDFLSAFKEHRKKELGRNRTQQAGAECLLRSK